MLTFEFNGNQTKQIKILAYKLNTTIEHIICLAMSLLYVVDKELKNGNQIVIIKNNKVVKKIIGIAR